MFKDKEELKNWIENYIISKGKASLHTAINNSQEIKSDIISFTNFLPDETKFNQRCFHILSELEHIPLCKECKLNKVNFNNRNRDWKYLDFCSIRCGRINKETVEKYKKTHLEKYGADNITKTEYFRDIMKDMNRERYGVDWYFESEEFRNKSILSCLKKYGFSNYTKTDEFKIKLREKMLEKFGVDWYSKSSEFKEKFRKTSIKKFGVEHPMLNTKFKEKVSKTINDKYGQKWYVLTKKFKVDSFDIKERRYGSPVGYKSKEYLLPSGRIIKVQGYENFALDILLKNYTEDDISVSYFEIKEEIGIINYLMDEINRIYLPDIYIKSENKIIEVKSEYTYNLELEKNILKKQACLSIDLAFEFWIMDPKGKLIDIK